MSLVPSSIFPRRSVAEQGVEYVHIQRVLQRVMSFSGVSIDDVVNDPIARNKVRAYYKLHRWVERGIEVHELERQWNPLGNP